MGLPYPYPPLPDPGREPQPGEVILLDEDHELECRLCTCCKNAKPRYFIIHVAHGTVSMGFDWRTFATAKGWKP